MKSADSPETVIIGAGIAGISAGLAFARRGEPALILERNSIPASEASGNEAALLSPYYLSNPNATSRWLANAFQFSVNLLTSKVATFSPHGAEEPLFKRTGITHLPATARLDRMVKESRAGRFAPEEIQYLAKDVSPETCGISLPMDALFLPQGGWCYPRQVCDELLRRAGALVSCAYDSTVSELTPQGDYWALTVDTPSEQYQLKAKRVIVTNSWEAIRFSVTAKLPLEPVRGSVMSVMPCSLLGKLLTVLCHHGYIIPISKAQQLLGATYRHGCVLNGVADHNTNPDEPKELLAQLGRWLPEAAPVGRVVRTSFRASTLQRLPIVGSVDGYQNLYTSVGHGSRGFVTAPYSGELIARQALERS